MDDEPKTVGSDEPNRTTWSRFAEEYRIEGWGDPGEMAALASVADLARGRPVLDLGVGGGRTTSLLRLLTSDYIGIDYTPEMVEICQARHPGLDIRLGDARELGDLSDCSRGLVLFSNNGIDAVDHDGRQQVLAGVRRVLEPGGVFCYSTLNKDGPLFGAHPGNAPDITWQVGSLLPRPTRPTVDGARGSTADAEEVDPTWARAIRNWRRLRHQTRDEGSWGLAPFAAHEFSLVTHFITLEGARNELASNGFDVEMVYPCDRTEPLAPGEALTSLYMHLIARRR
jgi:SAM-dependent methyltransferase